MLQLEIIQMLQMLLFLFVTFFIAYGFVHSFRTIRLHENETKISFSITTAVLYFRKLTVINYNCFHKLEIWRKYRFS